MGNKNGGQPHDILALEEALKRFARKRIENGAVTKDKGGQGSKVRYVDFSSSIKREEDVGIGREHSPRAATFHAPTDLDIRKGNSERPEIVAMISGAPRTLEDLEQIAAADQAFREDFPESSEEPEFREEESTAAAMGLKIQGRNTSRRDFVFGVMGLALLVWAGIHVARVPTVNEPKMFAKALPTPALRASSFKSAQELISTWVGIPDSAQLASARPLKPGELEAAIKDTLKMRAFTDIGVSVSHMGDAYLAGDVYSLAEARRIQQIVHRVSGVRRVYFPHPDVRPAQGRAYFGVTTAWAPEVWGAKVQAVFIGSPADKAGIRPGDVISEFDGKTVPDAKAFDDLIEQYSPGQRIRFRVWHHEQPRYLVARLGALTTVASR